MPNHKENAMNTHKGFTLIELLIVVAVIGVLASIAVPAYSDYVIRGKLVEASAQLSDARVKLEQFYQDNRSYGSSAGGCGIAVPTTPSKYFTFTCTWGADSTNQSYVVTATGVINSQSFIYTINEANVKTSITDWGNGASCWIMKKGDIC